MREVRREAELAEKNRIAELNMPPLHGIVVTQPDGSIIGAVPVRQPGASWGEPRAKGMPPGTPPRGEAGGVSPGRVSPVRVSPSRVSPVRVSPGRVIPSG